MDFKRAIQNLPEHEPRADLWGRIEADLRADAVIDRALEELPFFEPKADAWEQIAGQLEAPAVRPLRTRSFRWAIAAAVAGLLAGVWWLRQPVSDENVTLAYATETVDAGSWEAVETLESAADQKTESFIQQQCEQQTVVCQKPEVKELKQHLDELNMRKASVEEQLAFFGNAPDLVRAQIKIENERAEVTKELVQILTI